MKKLLVIMLAALFFMSCKSRDYVVKLPNGSLLPVIRDTDNNINYPFNSKVCVRKYIGRADNWVICTDGDMKDTVYINTYPDSTLHITEHKVGIIINP